MKVEVDVLGSLSLTVPTVSVDVKQIKTSHSCQSSGAMLQVVVDLLDSSSLTVLMVSVDVKQHVYEEERELKPRRQGHTRSKLHFSPALLVAAADGSLFIIIIIITIIIMMTIISVSWYLTDKAEHTALNTLNKVYA